jgi:hypothetical protein
VPGAGNEIDFKETLSLIFNKLHIFSNLDYKKYAVLPAFAVAGLISTGAGAAETPN